MEVELKPLLRYPSGKPAKRSAYYKLGILSVLFAAYLLYSTHIMFENRGYADEQFSAGKMVWQKYNCQSCHQLYGLGGYLGPDVTHVYKKGGPVYIKAVVQTGNITMPAFKLNNQELDDLVYFLKKMNESGNADPRKFSIKADGCISPP